MRNEQRKICEIKFLQIRRSKFGPHCLMTQGAEFHQYIGAGLSVFCTFLYLAISIPSAAFCQFIWTSPINFVLLGENGNTSKDFICDWKSYRVRQ
jgi:hypothetical protein